MTSLFIRIFLIAFLLVSCNSKQNSIANHANHETSPSTPSDGGTTNANNTAPNPYPTFRPTELRGETNFAKLLNDHLEGKVEPTPWAGFWWPYTGNGIAAMTASSFRSGASPAGRYDAARGGTTHAQEWEVQNHGARVPRLQSWWGHCNGWCASSALYPEPHSEVTVNGITFGIGDQKALLTEAGMSANADFFGDRIDVDDPSSPKYVDTVPDQLFLVLTTYIGERKQAVLIDRYTGAQVWNQPLAGYRFEYPKQEDYLGNSEDAPHVYRINLTGTIWWLDDGVAPDVQTVPFNYEDDASGMIQSRTLRMELWLDGPVNFDSSGRVTSSGNVVVTRQGEHVTGGAWKMGDGYLVDAWPDYMWVPYALVKPTDPEQDYVNPEIDIKWLEAHVLKEGGVDDPSVPQGTPIAPTPPVRTSPWPRPGGNSEWPGMSGPRRWPPGNGGTGDGSGGTSPPYGGGWGGWPGGSGSFRGGWPGAGPTPPQP